MRKICILFYLILLPAVTSAQDKIGYTYDSAGNRINRKAIQSFKKTMARHQANTSEDQRASDMLHDHSITICPNPTDGLLRINVSGLKGTDDCSLCFYTSLGTLIMTENVKKENIDINISNQPAGIYLLKITINDKVTTWKVIKK